MKTNPLLSGLICVLAITSSQVFADTTFRVDPSELLIAPGGAVLLQLQQEGPAQTFGLQWFRDGTPLYDDARTTGSQTGTLSIFPSQLEDAGEYTLTFTSVENNQSKNQTVRSSVAFFGAPAIEDIFMETQGASVTFTVIASGGDLSYQWMWQGQDIPGATSNVLKYDDAYASANAGYYSVRVSNPAYPEGVTSPPEALRFTKPTPGGTYQALFYNSPDFTMESAGFMQYTLSATKRSFSGKITMGTQNYSFSGVFSPTHDAVVQVSRANSSPLTLTLQLLTLNETPQVTGYVSDGQWTAPLLGNRAHFSSKTPTPLVGKYTLALHNTNASNYVPNGSGYASVVVQKTGRVTLKGQAADGATLSRTFSLSRQGDLPVYFPLNQSRGCLLGWLNFGSGSGGAITGTNVLWVRNAGPDAYYPGGFMLPIEVVGSSYSGPPTSPVLTFTNGVAGFYAGDLFTGDSATWDWVKVVFSPPASFRAEAGAEKVRLTVNKKTGVLSGSFIDIATGLKTPVRGVVLQQQDVAEGFFLSTSHSGMFSLVPGTPVH